MILLETGALGTSYLKADINSDIQLETASIFSIEPLSKTGYRLGVFLIDFICMGLLDLWGAQAEIYKVKNIARSGIRTRDIR